MHGAREKGVPSLPPPLCGLGCGQLDTTPHFKAAAVRVGVSHRPDTFLDVSCVELTDRHRRTLSDVAQGMEPADGETLKELRGWGWVMPSSLELTGGGRAHAETLRGGVLERDRWWVWIDCADCGCRVDRGEVIERCHTDECCCQDRDLPG